MVRSIQELASPYVRELVPYSPGKPIEEVERELGVKGSVKLASNENPLGPSPLALQAIRNALGEINRYPDGGGYYLRRALARKFDLVMGYFILGNGSNELIELAARCFLTAGDEAIIADPAFVVYKSVAQMTGSRQILVPLRDYRHDLEEMAKRVTSKTKMIFVGNPNNPTGTSVEPGEIEAFMTEVPEDIIVLFDEAYYEYMPEDLQPNTIRYVAEGRYVLTLRTFSKIYGLAGLRVGYGMAPPPLVELLNRAREPFNVNSLAQAGALAALDDANHLATSRRLNEIGKRYLYEQLSMLGLSFIPTAANFLLVDVGGDGGAIAQALMRKGVIVRPMGMYGLSRHLRVTIGTPQENERFIRALQEVLAES
ncbi:MAG: histidinol-phosphate transaminase [candidate division NC10 bacterium]|nr:histidinol-phosphate transaminase [candidate division NC10 bacterium]